MFNSTSKRLLAIISALVGVQLKKHAAVGVFFHQPHELKFHVKLKSFAGVSSFAKPGIRMPGGRDIRAVDFLKKIVKKS